MGTEAARIPVAPNSIMILGAGVYQLPLIRKVKEMGFRAVVVSIDGNYPGIREADVFLPVNTTDINAVIAAARENHICAVVTTGTDACIPTLGAVNDALSLPGISQNAATVVSHKHQFRRFQEEHNLPHPRFVVASEWTAMEGAIGSIRGPFYVKPVDSSGSRGVSRIATPSLGTTKTAFEFAKSFSRAGAVCCEAEIPGVEAGGNAVVFDSEIVFLETTEKHMNGVIVKGHSFPTRIPAAGQAAVKNAILAHAAALNVSRCILNFDIMVDGDTAQVIELGARPGGNGISDLIRRSMDYDMDRAVVDLALGSRPVSTSTGETTSCGTVVFGSSRAGRLERIASLEEIQRVEPSVFGLRLASKPGQQVDEFHHNANLIGYAMFDIPAGRQYQALARRIVDCLNIVVE